MVAPVFKDEKNGNFKIISFCQEVRDHVLLFNRNQLSLDGVHWFGARLSPCPEESTDSHWSFWERKIGLRLSQTLAYTFGMMPKFAYRPALATRYRFRQISLARSFQVVYSTMLRISWYRWVSLSDVLDMALRIAKSSFDHPIPSVTEEELVLKSFVSGNEVDQILNEFSSATELLLNALKKVS